MVWNEAIVEFVRLIFEDVEFFRNWVVGSVFKNWDLVVFESLKIFVGDVGW